MKYKIELLDYNDKLLSSIDFNHLTNVTVIIKDGCAYTYKGFAEGPEDLHVRRYVLQPTLSLS